MRPALTFALVAALAIAQPCQAQPSVVVRAGTRIELGVRRSPDELTVQGTLRDDLGSALPDRAVAVAVHEAREDFSVGPSLARTVVRSAADGGFVVTFPLPIGRYVLVAHVDNEPLYRGETVTRSVQLDLAPVRLDVALPDGTRLDLTAASHRVDIRAASEAGGGGLEISVRDELDRTLARGTTAADGTLAISLQSSALGAASVGRLFVESGADEQRADARTEVPIVRFRPTVLSLEADVEQISVGAAATLHGVLLAGSTALGGRAVGIFDGDTHLLTTLSGEDGGFEFSLDGRELAHGPRQIVARFESDAPWLSSSESPPLALEALTLGATPWRWIALCLGLTLLGLGLARALRIRRTPALAKPPVMPAAGVVLAQRRSILADVLEISGRVEDHVHQTPIANARVAIEVGAETIAQVWTEADGRFGVSVDRSASGRLKVEGAGYETVEEKVSLPHRGELRGMVVRLHSLRDAAWEAMRGVGSHVTGAAEGATAAEIVRAAERTPPVPAALPVLARAVEQAAWGPENPSSTDVGSIQENARAVSKELDRRAQGPR